MVIRSRPASDNARANHDREAPPLQVHEPVAEDQRLAVMVCGYRILVDHLVGEQKGEESADHAPLACDGLRGHVSFEEGVDVVGGNDIRRAMFNSSLSGRANHGGPVTSARRVSDRRRPARPCPDWDRKAST